MNDELSSLYAYSRWADERVLGALRALPREEYERELGGGWPSLRATWVHLAGATDAWHRRFSGEDAMRLPTAEELPGLEDAARLLLSAHDRLAPFVAALAPARLAGPFTWKNLKGIEKTAPFWSVLRHVVNHGTYHRGQISSMIRRVGGTPVSTDMVVWGIELHEAAGASR
jgi:uncharacterized damage-inducible protein DinB